MKKLLLCMCLLFATATYSADLKIAHVDSKLVFDKYADTKKAQKELWGFCGSCEHRVLCRAG